MGLTIHYQIKAAPETGAADARRMVSEGRILAERMSLRLALDAVGPVRWDERARQRAVSYLTFPFPGRKGSFVVAEILPVEGFVFPAKVGKDCEPLWLGLCRYPAVVETEVGPRQTRLGGCWRFSGFSKTQYASLHGWKHFLRCHRAIVDLLAGWRELGLAVRISDEGGYWPWLSERALRRNLDEMNGAVAAAAGALKDRYAENGGERPVVAPIFAHPNFERLEAEGTERKRARSQRRA